MSENTAGYTKVVVPVVQDIPAGIADKVLAGLQSNYKTYETGKGEDIKTHDTEFVVAGVGDYRRIEHNGRLGAPLKANMAAFAGGVVWQLSQTAPAAPAAPAAE